jgi:hypothetical protein
LEPSDVQVLRSKKYGKILCDKQGFLGGPGVGVQIIKTPSGGYRHIRGGEIKSEEDLITAIGTSPEMKEELEKALYWFRHRFDLPEAAPRDITFERSTGYPIYADTGEFVNDFEELQNFFPAGEALAFAYHMMQKRKEAGIAPKAEPAVTMKMVNEAPRGPSTAAEKAEATKLAPVPLKPKAAQPRRQQPKKSASKGARKPAPAPTATAG